MTPGSSPPPSVTALLDSWQQGDAAALDAILPLVEQELRRLARSFLRHERRGHTLQPTALVNEAYLRLAGQRHQWKNRAHFLAVAAQLMRLILVDYARRRHAAKRLGHAAAAPEIELDAIGVARPRQLVALDDALVDLARIDPRKARIAELKCFGGLTASETAQVLGVSESTVEKDWRLTRAWLHDQLR
ncbi:MAG: sigma-70 family RNA polymerase sigma factor [Acidobacteriota bacterium]